MSDEPKAREQQLSILKNELKAWEKRFAANNGGRKPGQEHMRGDATICTIASSDCNEQCR